MQPVPNMPTVLLRHDSPDGVHHDWLLGDPTRLDEPDAPLWTARVGPPSSEWTSLGAWQLEPIGSHRRLYLTYEGPLSGGRGTVTRVDEGTFVALEWTEQHILIDLAMRCCNARIDLLRHSPTRWQAQIVTPDAQR